MEHAKYKYNKYKLKLHNLTGGMLSPAESVCVASEISTNRFNVRGATVAMLADSPYILAAVNQDGNALEFAGNRLRAKDLITIARSHVGKGRYCLERHNVIIDNYSNYPQHPSFGINSFKVLFADWGKQFTDGKYSFIRQIAEKDYVDANMFINCWQFVLLCIIELRLLNSDDIKLLYYHDSNNKTKRIPDYFVGDIDIQRLLYNKETNYPLPGDILLYKKKGTAIFWHTAIFIGDDKTIENLFEKISVSTFSENVYDDIYIVNVEMLVDNIKKLQKVTTFLTNETLTINDNELYIALTGEDGVFWEEINDRLTKHHREWIKTESNLLNETIKADIVRFSPPGANLQEIYDYEIKKIHKKQFENGIIAQIFEEKQIVLELISQH